MGIVEVVGGEPQLLQPIRTIRASSRLARCLNCRQQQGNQDPMIAMTTRSSDESEGSSGTGHVQASLEAARKDRGVSATWGEEEASNMTLYLAANEPLPLPSGVG